MSVGILEPLVVYAIGNRTVDFSNVGRKFAVNGGADTCDVNKFNITIESDFDPTRDYTQYTPVTRARLSAEIDCFCADNLLNLCTLRENDGLYLYITVGSTTYTALVPITTQQKAPSFYPQPTSAVPFPSAPVPIKVVDVHGHRNEFRTSFDLPWIGTTYVSSAYGYIVYTSDYSYVSLQVDGTANPFFSVLYNKAVSSDGRYKIDVAVTTGQQFKIYSTTTSQFEADWPVDLAQQPNRVLRFKFPNPLYNQSGAVGTSLAGLQVLTSNGRIVFGIVFSGSVPITSLPNTQNLSVYIRSTGVAVYVGS